MLSVGCGVRLPPCLRVVVRTIDAWELQAEFAKRKNS